LAYGIIQEHQGSIYVQSEKGNGTTFNIDIPLKPISNQSEQSGGIHARHEDPDR